MSTGEKLGEMPASVKVNADFVRLLETALADAKAGKIVAGGVVAVVGPSSFMAFSVEGNFPAEVIAGTAVMQGDVIIKMRQPRSSPIMRAGGVPRFNG